MSQELMTRRDIIKKAAYIAPVIVTMPAKFAFASGGSGDVLDGEVKDKKDKKEKKN